MLPYTAYDMLDAIRRTYAIDPSQSDLQPAQLRSSRRRVPRFLLGTLTSVRSLLFAW